MGRKLKITESQLKMLVENRNKLQEQNESEVDELNLMLGDPSKEEYLARHGEDPMGWTGKSNSLYKDVDFGDNFGDEETYDDFDTLHTSHPEFHKHYTNDVDQSRSMFDRYKEKFGPLRIRRRKPADEYDPFYDRDQEINYGVVDDDMMNESIRKIKEQFKRFL